MYTVCVCIYIYIYIWIVIMVIRDESLTSSLFLLQIIIYIMPGFEIRKLFTETINRTKLDVVIKFIFCWVVASILICNLTAIHTNE